MFRRTFKITYKPMKNNFVLIPDHYYKLVSTYENGCLSLTFGNYSHHTTWVPYAGGTLQDTEIGMNARVAKEIGLKEGDMVKCTLVTDAISLRTVNVTPVTARDWEIIELSSEKLTDNLLDQVKIINSSQILVAWINKSMQVCLTVDRIKPIASFGRIDHTTELIVAPNTTKVVPESLPKVNDLSKSKTTASFPAAENSLTRSSTMKNVRSMNNKKTQENREDKLQMLTKDLKKENSRTFEFRVLRGKWEDNTSICDVYITKHNLPEFMDLSQIYSLKTSEDNEYFVNVKVVADSEDHFPTNIHPTIEVNENLMKIIKIKEFEKVSLQSKHGVLNFAEKIELYAEKKTHYKILENAFKKYVLAHGDLAPVLLNQGQILRLEDNLYVTIGISPDHFKFCIIDGQFLKECKIYATDVTKKVDEILEIEEKKNSILSIPDLIELDKFDQIVDDMVEQLKNDLCLDSKNSVLRQGNIVICGPSNTGKTILVERILDRLAEEPYYCNYGIYQCTRNKGRKIESIQRDLRQLFTDALNRSPSIVVLENLDILAHSSGEQQTHDGEYYSRIADVVQHLIIEYTSSNAVAVIATVSDVQSLNKRLYTPRGRHLFHKITRIPDLETEDRLQVLEELCSHIDFESTLDLEKYSNLTEGYNMGDLVQFVERGIFYAYRVCKSHPVLTNELLKKSLENTNSYCLQGIEKHGLDDDEEDQLSVHEIAGMQPVVKVLEEVLMWPSRYPSIFKESPLRNQAGVLLFGPPGTGKTFLVSQIAHSWNLRTISVKGPELLAKYIGQSEENVRNLFNKARSAKPCVLFFDEFDSLAPKRGHDSTGVTDRVVNQLLTELDGVEGLQGVTVIAATSRPELLDPALLRSGRIDRLVECTLPDYKSRLGIFKTLSKSLHFDESVDLGYFAEVTENYTGADIQSILVSANMTALKELLVKTKGDKDVPDKVYISQEHILSAYETTRPSLSLRDIEKYTRTYARFTNKEKSREVIAQRATLA